MKKTIISLDTDRIKKYVFATGTLKEIRGASAILDELNRKTMFEKISDIDSSAKPIYANGGSGMFIVSDEAKGRQCIEVVKKLYRDKTLTGSVSGALTTYDDQEDFSNVYNVLGYRLRRIKDEKEAQIHPATHSFLRPCDACGEEYAQHHDQEDVVCKSCMNKREKDYEIKESISKILASPKKTEETAEGSIGKDRPISIDDTWKWLLKELIKAPNYNTQNKKRPEDFEAIGKLSEPKNYMGLIYADGNNMGKQLEGLQTDDQISDFSVIVDNAIHYSVLEAVKNHLNPKPEDENFPFDILMLGGDDLVMVTPAHKAIETAITVAKEFQKYSKDKFEYYRLGDSVDLSVGVAIAHVKFPFGSLLDLTESLLKFAKQEGAKRKLKDPSDVPQQGMLNFQVVNASSSPSFAEYFKKHLYFKEESRVTKQSKKYYRTLRPYDIEKMGWNIVDGVKLAKKHLPRNKIQAFRESVFLDYGNSILEALAIYNRLKSNGRNRLMEIYGRFSKTNRPEPIPWFKEDGKVDEYYTPFLDIAELYDFIQGDDDDEN